MTSFISVPSIIHPRVWRLQKRPSRRRLGFVRMQVKRIWRVPKSLLGILAIMTAHWPNWKLPAKPCPMIARVFRADGSHSEASGALGRDHAKSRALALSSTRAILKQAWGFRCNYTFLRRYADQKSALASALAVFPNDLRRGYAQAYVEFDAKADTRPLHQMLDSIRATNPAAMPDIADSWLWLRAGRARRHCRKKRFRCARRKSNRLGRRGSF